MCGRLNITDSPEVLTLLKSLGLVWQSANKSRYNIAPTENVLVIYESEDGLQLEEMRWWLVPSWSSGPSNKFAMFNARIETVATSKAYKTPFKTKRCVVIASSFVEWHRGESGKQPYLIEAEQQPLLLAGIWDEWQGEIKSCSIITQAARKEFEWLHHRMPLALTEAQLPAWLGETNAPENLLDALRGQCVSLSALEIDNTYNNARNKAKPIQVSEAKAC